MEMTTAKTVAVFIIIIGCFAVLYPKIFHPMIVHMFSGSQPKANHDDVLNRIPPHLRKPPGGGGPMDEMHKHMRPGPHPGLRAAAEMKKQASTTGTGTGRGLMSVVLPMYAVGIVVYLIYTLTKVFGKNEKQPTTDYLGKENPFSDIRYNAERKKFVTGHEDDEPEDKGEKRQLERLLLKADERNITEIELRQLKTRLLETEAQMTRILKAMESVTTNVNSAAEQVVPGTSPTKEYDILEDMSPTKSTRSFDSSPDMDTYEIVNGIQRKVSKDTVEDIGASKAGECDANRTTSAHGYNQTSDDVDDDYDDEEPSREEDADDEAVDDAEEEEEEEAEYDDEYDEEEEEESEEARLGADDEEDEEADYNDDSEEDECIEKVIGDEKDAEIDHRVNDAHPDLRQRKMPAAKTTEDKSPQSSQ